MRHRGNDQAGFSWEIALGLAFVPHQFHRAAWLEFSLNLWDLIRQTRARTRKISRQIGYSINFFRSHYVYCELARRRLEVIAF